MFQTSPPIRPFDFCLALAVQAIAVALWLALGRSWIVPGLACATLMGAIVIRLRGPQALWPAGLMLLALVWGIGIALDLPADGQGRVALLAIGLGQAMVLAQGVGSAGAAAALAGAVLLPIAGALLVQGDPTWASGLLLLGAIQQALRRPVRIDPLALEPNAPELAPTAAAPSNERFELLVREAALAREQAAHALSAAHQAVHEKTRFLAAASHDLRQPIHAIGLFVGALKEEIRDGRGRYLVDRLERSMAGLDELFNRLLDISRLDAGTIEPKVSVFAIGPLLQTLETRFAHMAEQRRLDFRVHVPRPCSVRSDPALLVEILMNLLSNAFRYTERGGILMGTRRRGDRLLIQV